MATQRGAIVWALVGLSWAGCKGSKDSRPGVEEPAPVAPAAVVIDAAASAEAEPDPEEPLVESWKQVPGLTDAVALVDHGVVGCALRRTGAIVCWPTEAEGDDAPTLSPTPLAGMGPAVAIADLTLDSTLCAAGKDGKVTCLTPADDARPTRIPGIRDAVEVDGGIEEACARTRSGQIWCWRRDDDPPAPTRVKNLPPMTSLTMEYAMACGLDRERQLWCWNGLQSTERAELKLRACEREPSYLADERNDRCTESDAAAIGKIDSFLVRGDGEPSELFYAIIEGRAHYAYMDKAYGEHRAMTKDTRGPPIDDYLEVFPAPADTRRIVGDSVVACAVTGAGATHCWGEPYGERPRLSTMPTPVAVKRTGSMLCVLTAEGTVSCWQP